MKNGITGLEIAIVIAIIALLIAIIIGSLPSKPKSQTKTENGYEYQTTTIEGCEYFVNRSYSGHYGLTHKGNCTNVIHRSEYENPR